MDKDQKDNTQASTTASPVWLRTCEKETLQPVEGKVKGNLPPWLNGRLTRNGPGKVQYGKTRFNHLFDGSSYVHQFIINDGKVFYQSRYLQSDAYKKNTKADRIVVSEFGTAAYPDPCKNILQRFMSHFTPITKVDPTDNCVVNVCHYGDQLYALTETKNMRRIDPETLATVGEKTKLDQYIAVNTATAHPHVDPDGTVYNMGNSYANKKGPTYNIIKFPPPKVVNGQNLSSVEQAEIIATIPCQWKMYPSYYHSFGITDNYFVFVEQPFVFNLKKFLLNHYLHRPYLGAVEWYADQKTKFRVVRRDTLELMKTTYVTDAFVTFHHTNAFEKDGQLVVDLAAMDDGKVINQFMLRNFEKSEHEISAKMLSTHRRFVLPLEVDDVSADTNLVTLKDTKCSAYKRRDGTIQLQAEVISKQAFDLPRINYKYNGKEYTYAYGVEVNTKAEFAELVKMNVQTGETWLWREEGKLVSEPVFVATPGGTREDDGVVLSTIIAKADPKFVALLVLDPETWTEMARVEFQACGTVPSTFHGQFAAADQTVHLY
ncbi:carotenoid-cleaving dioxygenase, mitochondrial-like [Panulirus ornatus]|uniref:carotenoid-cleaving dioxygenase, mitochondrial-like n=1 Tax=Panulirus ornatus TaxID=150431 RepID=UPI003A8A33B8